MIQEEKWRESLLSTMLLLGGIVLIFFTFWDAFRGLRIDVIVDIVCGVAIWISLFYVKTKHSYYGPATVVWLVVLLVDVAGLFTGGTSGSGLTWWSLLPITSYVLFSKSGTKRVAVGLLILLGMTLLNLFGVVRLYFSPEELIQAGIMVIVISLIIYYYDKIVVQSKEEIEEKTRLLEEQMSSKKNTEDKLIDNLKMLEIEKEGQLKIRSAMLNLLEDGRDLEKQLKEEKAGIEVKIEDRTKELSDAKAKLDSSIENLPLGFLMVDIEEKLVVTNSLAKKTLGGKDEKLRLKTLKTILKEKVDLGKYIKNCNKEKKRLVFNDIELDSKYFQFLLSPILTKEDNVCIGIVVLIQDITEAKILERSKDEFFSIASHELRTPLTAIRGNTSMILEYYAEAVKEPELKAMIDDIHESSIRLINIVNDFLNVSRLEQGRLVYDIKEFDLDKLIPEILKEYNVTGSQKKIGLEYLSPTAPMPLVKGDMDKVRQVLINLVGNSLKFTPEGKITITTELVGKTVKTLVADTGRGISLKQQNLLFHKFQQAGESLFTRDTSGGSGLGLYISKKMIEGMGGEIKLEKSEENKGSTFSFTLPVV